MKILRLVIFLLIPTVTFAQTPSPDYGENKVETKGYLNVLKIYLTEKNYDKARDPLFWLLTNAPKLDEDLYRRASIVYESLEAQEVDPERRLVLQDSSLWVYDKRMEYFGESAEALNQKGDVAYRFLSKRKGTFNTLYDLYTTIYAKNPEAIYPQNAMVYMFLASSKKEAGQLTNEELITLYNGLSLAMDKQLLDAENASAKKRTEILYTNLERKFIASVDLDCEQIEKVFGSKFKEKPSVENAKRLQNMLTQKKCLDSPLLIPVLTYLNSKQETIGYLKLLASLYYSAGSTDSAMVYYTIIIDGSYDKEDKGESHKILAQLYKTRGQKSTARKHALRMIALGYETSWAYTFIGNLYFYSANDCASGDELKDRLIYIAAYDMYAKAANESLMQEAKRQFPSRQDIFERNKEVGDLMNTGCWVAEDVKLQIR